MASIGNLSFKVGLDLGGFLHDVQAMQNQLRQSQQFASTTSSAFIALANSAMSAAKAFGGVIAEGIGQAAAVDKVASGLGIAASSVQVFEEAAVRAGLATGQADQFLRQFAAHLGEAQVEASAARKGFFSAGFDPDQLGVLKLDTALFSVVERLREMPTAADRARAATKLFGNSRLSAGILQITQGQDLAAVRESLHKSGVLLSDEDAIKARVAEQSWRDLQLHAEGLAVTIGTRVAPFITEIVDMVNDWLNDTEAVTKGVDFLGDGLKFVVVQATEFGQAMTGVAAVIGENVLGSLIATQRALASAAAAAGQFDAAAGLRGSADEAQKLFDTLERGAKGIAALNPGATWTAWIDEVKKKAEDMARSIKDARAGMAGGASQAELAKLAALWEKGQQLMDKLHGQNPLAQLRQRIAEINQIEEAGGFGGSPDAADRLRFQAFQELAGSHPAHTLAGSADLGSVASVEAINKFQAEKPNNIQERIEQWSAEQTQILRLVKQYAKDASDALKQITRSVV
jgi:hypothetical protein